MEMLLVSPCTSGITRLTGIEMEENESYLQALGKRSCSELRPVTPSLFGEGLLTNASTSEQESGNQESIALPSETRARSSLPTSYVKHARSLLIAGLIAGITPTSIRKRLGADCREAALFPQDGSMSAVEAGEPEPEAGNLSLSI